MKATLAILFVACFSLLTLGQGGVLGQEKNTPAKGIDPATVAAYERLGGEYGGWLDIDDQFRVGRDCAVGFLPGFRFKTFPKTELPNVAVPFGLVANYSIEDTAKLKKLAHLKRLATLEIANDMKDRHLRDLREIGLLHTLWVAEGKDKETRPRSAEDVVELNLGLSSVTNAGLKELAPLRNLAALDLESTKVTDAGLKELTRFQKLDSLVLSNTRVTDIGLRELVVLKKLTFLDLRGTKITDAGLKELGALQNLTTVELDRTDVSDAGVLQLRKALPKCKIAH